MDGQLRQNLLLSLQIGMLGMVANALHTVADRMALTLGRPASAAGLFISVYALGSLCSVVVSSGLADRVGKRRVIAAGLSVMALGFLTGRRHVVSSASSCSALVSRRWRA